MSIVAIAHKSFFVGEIFLMLDSLACLVFELRSGWALQQLTAPETYGTIAYEYEKNSYPLALADVLATNEDRDEALAFLQQLDPQATGTLGVDLHSGFVLKAQTRKYFAFGDRLDPAYRDRMFQAMDTLADTDPLTREAQTPRRFWERSTDNCTTPVDCRNTDNLRAMRETSLYLMAEETGNTVTQQIYRDRLARYTQTLLSIGMGEWDSPTYHGHTTAAYLNLYDFAVDPEVKHIAQTALDWLFRSAALKYWRGSWLGPAKRLGDDNAAAFFWLYFGDAPPPETLEKDWIHALTSRYRPSAEVLRLAQRNFPKPVEIRRTHPHYENWKPGLYGPAFYETLYLAHTYQLGTLAQGSAGDWTGFSLHMAQGNGTDELIVTAEDAQAIAQFNNLVLWWSDRPPTIEWPAGSRSHIDGITFVKTEGTWLAYHPFAHGFALEIGETQSHGTFEQFQTAVLRRARLTTQSAEVTYRSSQGDRLRLRPQGNRLPDIWRNGQLHDWATHANPDELNRLARSPNTLTLP